MKLAHQENVVRGMLAATGAFFMFTLMNVFAKLLSVNHSVIEIAFYRNLVACLPFLFLVFVLGRRDILVIRSQPAAVVFRAVLGALVSGHDVRGLRPHAHGGDHRAAVHFVPVHPFQCFFDFLP